MSSDLPRTFGNYSLLKLLARGGMGEIYLARTSGIQAFEKYYAVKKLLKKFTHDNDVGARFIDEAKLGARLQHPNIVQVYDLGKVNDELYMATEFVDGFDLRRVLRFCHEKKKRIPLDIALFLVREILSGLAYAHRQVDAEGQSINLIHRDISPQNVLVSFEGEVKIIDFGLAKSTQRSQETQANVLLGNFGYMSPEQARGHQLDVRTDVYSAGIVLFELVTGTKRFVEENPLRLLEMVARPTPIMPSDRVPGLPKAIDKLYALATAPNREDRYESAEAFRDDVTAALHKINPKATREHLAQFLNHLFLGGQPPPPVDPDLLDRSVALHVQQLYAQTEAFIKPKEGDVRDRKLTEFSDEAPQTGSHALMRAARVGDVLSHKDLCGDDAPTEEPVTLDLDALQPVSEPVPPPRAAEKPPGAPTIEQTAPQAPSHSGPPVQPSAAPAPRPPSGAHRVIHADAPPTIQTAAAAPPAIVEAPRVDAHVFDLGGDDASGLDLEEIDVAMSDEAQGVIPDADAFGDESDVTQQRREEEQTWAPQTSSSDAPLSGAPTGVYASPSMPGRLDEEAVRRSAQAPTETAMPAWKEPTPAAAAPSISVSANARSLSTSIPEVKASRTQDSQIESVMPPPPAPAAGTPHQGGWPPGTATNAPPSTTATGSKSTVVTTIAAKAKPQPTRDEQPSIVIDLGSDEPTMVGGTLPAPPPGRMPARRPPSTEGTHVDGAFASAETMVRSGSSQKEKGGGGFGEGGTHDSLIIDFDDPSSDESKAEPTQRNPPARNTTTEQAPAGAAPPTGAGIRPAAQPLGKRVVPAVAQARPRPRGASEEGTPTTTMPPPTPRRR